VVKTSGVYAAAGAAHGLPYTKSRALPSAGRRRRKRSIRDRCVIVILEDVPTGHIARGATEARTFVQSALRLAPGASYEVLAALVNGEQFAVEWVMRPAGLHGASVGTARNGNVTTSRDF
jgi:hypothetical protein